MYKHYQHNNLHRSSSSTWSTHTSLLPSGCWSHPQLQNVCARACHQHHNHMGLVNCVTLSHVTAASLRRRVKTKDRSNGTLSESVYGLMIGSLRPICQFYNIVIFKEHTNKSAYKKGNCFMEKWMYRLRLQSSFLEVIPVKFIYWIHILLFENSKRFTKNFFKKPIKTTY